MDMATLPVDIDSVTTQDAQHLKNGFFFASTITGMERGIEE